MGRDVFYITTPIYYPNDVPHIGHAYTSVATDFVARYHRLRGEEVLFLTGTDEHGLKLQRAAEAEGVDPQTWVERMDPKWREVWARLEISYDDYIRTTEPRHVAAVQKILTAVHENGRPDIYLDVYEGLYCVSCELYYSEEDLVEGNCPIHARPVEVMREDNYFFRLSAYGDRLLERYQQHPDSLEPEIRRNEVLSLINRGLKDFSISRTNFDWGIPLPWDPKHVCYVWFDALTNYITAAGYADDPERFARAWPANVHVIGKDILRQHAIYWPAMLMAAGVEPPSQVWAHGYLLVGGEKMSKTKLTGIHPFQLLDHFGVDSYRYYFMREIQFGQDGSFSWESMVDRHNADLANGLGNLASRVLAMLGSYFDGLVPDPTEPAAAERLPGLVGDVVERYDAAMQEVALSPALASVWEIVAEANRYLVEKAPWAIAKDPDRQGELGAILYGSAEVLRILAVMISPIMPSAAARLWEQLGIPHPLEAERSEVTIVVEYDGVLWKVATIGWSQGDASLYVRAFGPLGQFRYGQSSIRSGQHQETIRTDDQGSSTAVPWRGGAPRALRWSSVPTRRCRSRRLLHYRCPGRAAPCAGRGPARRRDRADRGRRGRREPDGCDPYPGGPR